MLKIAHNFRGTDCVGLALIREDANGVRTITPQDPRWKTWLLEYKEGVMVGLWSHPKWCEWRWLDL